MTFAPPGSVDQTSRKINCLIQQHFALSSDWLLLLYLQNVLIGCINTSKNVNKGKELGQMAVMAPVWSVSIRRYTALVEFHRERRRTQANAGGRNVQASSPDL